MAFGIDDALLLSGAGILTNTGNGIINGILGSLFSSGGSAADDQMAYNWKLVEPQVQLGGKSYQQIANQLQAQLNQKLTDQQSAATWSLAQKYATQLPVLQRLGYEAANINPILAYSSLGSSGSPVVGSSSGSSVNPPGLTATKSHVTGLSGSAVNIRDLYETISGILDSKHDEIKADVKVKNATADQIGALTDETKARTAKEISETQMPGILGQGVRSAMSTGKEIREGISDLFDNLKGLLQDSLSPSVDVKFNGEPHSHHEYKNSDSSKSSHDYYYQFPF